MKGDNVADVERVLQRLERRSNKVAKAIISPFPVSNKVSGDVKGDVLFYMFCAEGIITKGMIHIDKKPKTPIDVKFKLEGKEGGRSINFPVDKVDFFIESGIPVRVGDRLTVSVIPAEGEVVNELWISFLWIPTVKDVEVKSFLMEELENDQVEG